MCAVLADSVPLTIPADTYALNETLGVRPEAAHVDWQLYRPKYGNSVEISSGVRRIPCARCFVGQPLLSASALSLTNQLRCGTNSMRGALSIIKEAAQCVKVA